MKVKFYLAMTAAAFLMTNCSQDENLIQTKGSTNTLTAAIESASRSTVTDGGIFAWADGDAIAVGNAESSYTKFEYNGETFTAQTAIVPTGYAIYPYNEAYATLPETGLPSITLAGSYAYGSTNAPMLATITEGATSLTFNHLAGLMRFRVKGIPQGTTEFSLTADMSITGSFTPEADNEGKTCIKAGTGDTNKEVKITFTSVEDVMDFYVPMPVGEYTSLTVKIGDKTLASTSGVTNTISRGKLLLMPTMVFENGDLKLEGGNNVSLNDEDEVDLEVSDGEEVVVEMIQGTTATLNLTAPASSTEGLSISDGSEEGTASSQSQATLNVTVENAPKLDINTPTLTVNLTSGTYGEVTAKTATNTLEINEKVTIDKLTVNGGNIKLKGNATINSLIIPEGVEMTIDLNGKVLTINSESNGIVNNGNLIIVNGTISHSAATDATNWTAGQYTDMTAAIRNNATAALTNVSINSNVYTVNNFGDWDENGSQKVTDQEVTATLTISGGSYISSKDKNSDPNGPNAYSIMCVDNAKAIISGDAKIQGAGGGLAVCWANAELDKCTLTGNNSANTGAHDLYMIGGSQVTYTTETVLTHDNKRLQDENNTGNSYIEKYGACSFLLKVADSDALEEAIVAGQSVQLTKSISLSSALTIEKTQVVTIDLNENELILGTTGNGIAGDGIVNNGTLIVRNGTIEFSASTDATNWTAGQYTDMTAAIRNNATATLTNVSINSNVYTVNNFGDWDENGSQKVTDQEVTATLTISGGSYISSKDKSSDPNGPNAYSIMCVDNAKAIISGDATIQGAGGGLAVCWANAELDDCTLTGNNSANTGAHDLYMIGGSQVTYTTETVLTHNNKRLQDENNEGQSYVEKYGACSYTQKN